MVALNLHVFELDEHVPIVVALVVVHDEALFFLWKSFTPLVEVVSIPDRSVSVMKNVLSPSIYDSCPSYLGKLAVGASESVPPV